MRTAKIVLLTVGALAAVGLAIAGFLLKQSFSARNPPSDLETWLARSARRIATPADVKALTNPSLPSPETFTSAREHFVEHCSACHALDGSGNTIFGRNMYPRVPDLRKPETQSLTDGELHYTISNGVRFTGMPGFGGEDKEEEIWNLVLFLRRLPSMSQQELREMDKPTPEMEDHDSTEMGAASHMHPSSD